MKIKKILCYILLATMLLYPSPNDVSHAQEHYSQLKEKISDNLYCITEITETISPNTSYHSTTKTKAGTKTVRYENSSGETLWTLELHATFRYTGTSSTCTSTSVSSTTKSKNWTITNKSSWKSGSTGYASALIKHTISSIDIESFTRTISLTCSNNGTLQ